MAEEIKRNYILKTEKTSEGIKNNLDDYENVEEFDMEIITNTLNNQRGLIRRFGIKSIEARVEIKLEEEKGVAEQRL